MLTSQEREEIKALRSGAAPEPRARCIGAIWARRGTLVVLIVAASHMFGRIRTATVPMLLIVQATR